MTFLQLEEELCEYAENIHLITKEEEADTDRGVERWEGVDYTYTPSTYSTTIRLDKDFGICKSVAGIMRAVVGARVIQSVGSAEVEISYEIKSINIEFKEDKMVIVLGLEIVYEEL